MWSGQWPGPEPTGSSRAWASNVTIVLRAGPRRPGLHILFAGRAGPGPHNLGPARAGSAHLLRARGRAGLGRASNYICGPGLGLHFRPVQGPSPYRRRPSTFSSRSLNSCSRIDQCRPTAGIVLFS